MSTTLTSFAAPAATIAANGTHFFAAATLNSTGSTTRNIVPTSSSTDTSSSSSSTTLANISSPGTPQFFASPSVSGPEPTSFIASSIFLTSPAESSTSSAAGAQSSAAAAHNDGLSTMAVAGLSLGLGLLLGLLSATLIYFYRRRRAAKNEGSGRPREWSGKQPVDGESLLGFQNQEKQPWPAPQPVAVPPAHVRIMDWVQRTRATSMSSLAPSYFPIIESDIESVVHSESTVHRSASTVMRSQSIASSRSAYSQASAPLSRVSDESHETEKGPSRPPHLYMITE